MATLISDTHYILVVGDTVISAHKTEAAAERRGKRETAGNPFHRRIYSVYAPGEIFAGHSWADVPSVRRASYGEEGR
jgi:hypothetical protein